MTLQTMIGSFIGGWEMIFLGVGGGLFAFWIWMIVDCANNEKEGSTKIAWLLVILLAGIVGAPLYFLVRKLPRKSGQSQT